MDKRQVNFGFTKVGALEKIAKVSKLFHGVSGKYDLMNDLMSFYTHRWWKDFFVKSMEIPRGGMVLDVACGSGDIGFGIKNHFGYKEPRIYSFDLTESMILNARGKFIEGGLYDRNCFWCVGNGQQLPFGDGVFDVLSVSFGIRNFAVVDDFLQEAHRVLKPGGVLYCMEFSHIKNRCLAKIYDWYAFNLIPAIGEKVANDRGAYRYLAESIKTFDSAEELLSKFEGAGFGANYNCLMNGLVAIHIGRK